MKISKEKVAISLVVIEGLVSIVLGVQLRKKSKELLRANGLVKEDGIFDEESAEDNLKSTEEEL